MLPNWIDLLLGAIILVNIILGWRRGFLFEFIDLANWIASLWSSIRFYQPAAQWVSARADLAETWSKPLAFVALFFVCLALLRLITAKPLAALPARAHRHPANRFFGLLPGMANGAIHAIIIAALLIAVPLPVKVHDEAAESKLNKRFTGYAEIVESTLRPVFDDAVSATLTMQTVRPQSRDMVTLPFSVQDARPRAELEVQMLQLVNKERTAAGLRPLVMDEGLTKVARKHSGDMLARGYFSHYSPEGKSAFDRLRADKVFFLLAGENLAFAPSVKIAHNGLMTSPGHRANILRPQFRKVGIGIMDAGPRGIMVTQQFSN